MKRTDPYAVLTLFLVLFFVFAGMKGMDALLQAKEKQLLTEGGQAQMEISVRAREEKGEEGRENSREKNGEKESAGDSGYLLTVRQMEDSVKRWNERIEEIFHEPAAGQISMEEAMERGEEWLEEMGFKEPKETEVSLQAVLSVGRQEKDEQTEPYDSFWTVWFSDQTSEAVLYVNAAAGKVWGAEITCYGNQEAADDGLERFVLLAGVEAQDEDGGEADPEKTTRVLAIKDSRIYAQEDSYSMASVGKGDRVLSYSKIIYRFTVQ